MKPPWRIELQFKRPQPQSQLTPYPLITLNLATVSAGMLVLTTTATSQQLLHSVDNLGSTNDGFAVSGTGIGDIDGDGRDDYVVGAYLLEVGGLSQVGAIRTFSGADGSLIFETQGPEAFAWFGFSVDRAGDLNGDGTEDILVGAPGLDPANFLREGSAHVISGADGTYLSTYLGTTSGGRFGYAVARVADTDGDGLPEHLIGAPFHEVSGGAVAGRADLYSGATGALLLEVSGAVGSQDLGREVAGVGDWNADGRGDFAVYSRGPYPAAQMTGEIVVYSGADASPLFALNGPDFDAAYSARLASGEDLNGDGVIDLAVIQTDLFAFPTQPQRITVISGADQTTLLEVVGPLDFFWGEDFALTPDANGDEVPDLLVAHTASLTVLAELYSGKTGGVLTTIAGSAQSAGNGNFVASLGDTNGDNLADWLVSDLFRQDILQGQYGAVDVYSLASTAGEICDGSVNSTGFAAKLEPSGSTVVADASFAVTVSSLPVGSPGILLSSRAIDFVTLPFSTPGELCIAGASVGRGLVQVTPAGGILTFPVDLNAVPLPDGQGYLRAVQPGETIMWQYWYDDAGMGAGGYRFSNAIAVPFE